MDIFTARYQNAPAIVDSGLQPVRITLGAPRFRLPYAYTSVPILAPTRQIFGLRDDAAFDRAYMAQLEAHGVDLIRGQIDTAADGHDGVVLLCFEDLRTEGPNGCHRRVFARWWLAQTGDAIPELPETIPPKVKARRAPANGGATLFDA